MLKYKKKIISALMKKKLFCDIFSSVWQYPQIEIFGPKSHLSLEYISLWKKFVKDAYYNLLILGIWSPVGILKIHPTHTHTHPWKKAQTHTHPCTSAYARTHPAHPLVTFVTCIRHNSYKGILYVMITFVTTLLQTIVSNSALVS